ncbi:unnamed protein product [Dibothriocephalus latus]|uniref:Uncharacterized protein n=1 Tax=Dibothriocephalus latus TaxID=60516 RepID=A0A3P7NL92_DIBLA|nr:unnamed protein product [Dibothriocephalus latus]
MLSGFALTPFPPSTLQLAQFLERTKLEEQVATEQAALLFDQHQQLRDFELKNQSTKHQLQRSHLEEKRTFLCEEQMRYDEGQKVKFEKEKRIRLKQLEKELKVGFELTVLSPNSIGLCS